MTEKCAWCGRPIDNAFFWTENTRGVKIHSACLEFLWKVAYQAKKDLAFREEVANHFDAIRAYHSSVEKVEGKREEKKPK